MSKSVFSRFLSGVFFTSAGRFVTVVLGFLSMLIYARWIPEAEFGGFVLLQVLLGFGAGYSNLGVSIAITRFIASTEDEYEHQKLTNTFVTFNFMMLLAVGILTLVFPKPFFLLFGSELSAQFLYYLPLLLVVEGLSYGFGSVLKGQFRFNRTAMMDFLTSLVSFITTVIFVIVLKQGVMGLVWARVISRMVNLIYSWASVRMKIIPRFDFVRLFSMLKFGFPLFINSVLDFIFSRADTVLIGLLLGPAQIAMYEYARKIPESISMMYESFRNVYFPYMSKFYADGEHARFSNVLNNSNRLVSFLGAVGVIIAFGFGDPLFQFLFSERYLPAVPAFGVLMIGLIFIALDSNLGFSLVAIGETNKPPLINTLRALVSFGGYFLLIPSLGNVGAALAGVVGTAIANPLNVYFLKRNDVGVKMFDYIKPIIILAVCFSPILFLQQGHYLVYIVMVLAYLLISFSFSVFTRGDIALAYRETLNMIKEIQSRFFSKAKTSDAMRG